MFQGVWNSVSNLLVARDDRKPLPVIVYLVQRQGIKIQRETFVSSEPAILFLFFLPLEKELVSETRGLDGKSCIKTKELCQLKKIILFNTNLYNFTTAYYQKKNKRLPRCYGAPGL